MPILKNVLPKTKGFNSCLQEPRSSIDAVYDITIAYKHRLPTFLYNVYAIDPSKIHTISTTFKSLDIPTMEGKVAGWLIEHFGLKDERTEGRAPVQFTGHFSNKGTEGDLLTCKCLANFAAVVRASSHT